VKLLPDHASRNDGLLSDAGTQQPVETFKLPEMPEFVSTKGLTLEEVEQKLAEI
jgi:hypothetical protein